MNQHADMSICRWSRSEQAFDEILCTSGEQSVREANAARFKQTCQREFEAFKKERLATGELECQKLITAAQSHLTQVRPLSNLAASLQHPCRPPAHSTCVSAASDCRLMADMSHLLSNSV